jgi:hypothetical protein
MGKSTFAKAMVGKPSYAKACASAEASATRGRRINKKPEDICLPASTKLLTKPTWAKPSNQLNLWALF